MITIMEDAKNIDAILVARDRNGEIRAACHLRANDDQPWSCEELAQLLSEWHETDPDRRVYIIPAAE